MALGKDKKNKIEKEQEVSSGAVIGYVLLGFAAVLLVAFIIFAVVKSVTGDKGDSAPAVPDTQAYVQTIYNV